MNAPAIDLPAWTHASVLVEQAVAEAELRTEYPDLHGLSTGVKSIDEQLSPILEPGRLVVVAAESGQGKTAFAAQLATAFAFQVPVLWCSLEDDSVDSVRRALANVARTPVSALRNGYRTGTLPDALRTGADQLSNLPLSLIDVAPDAVSLAYAMLAWTKATPAVQSPLGGVVIIDQLSHIGDTPQSDKTDQRLANGGLPLPPRPRDPEHKHLEWKVNILREVARKLNVLVVMLHQLNNVRDEVTGKPTLASLRGSSGIVHKADAVLVPWRPKRIPNPFAGPGEPATAPAPEGAAELLCLKGRSISSGWGVDLTWDGAHQRFAERNELDMAATSYNAPAAPTSEAMEGARRLADLRAKFVGKREALAATPPPVQIGTGNEAEVVESE